MLRLRSARCNAGYVKIARIPRDVGYRIVRCRLNAPGFASAPKSPEEFSVFPASEVQKYTKIVNAIGLKID